MVYLRKRFYSIDRSRTVATVKMPRSDTQFKQGNKAAKGRSSKNPMKSAFRRYMFEKLNEEDLFETIFNTTILPLLKSPKNVSEGLDILRYLAPITKKELEGDDEVLFTESDKRIIEEINNLSLAGLKAMSEVMNNPKNLKESEIGDK